MNFHFFKNFFATLLVLFVLAVPFSASAINTNLIVCGTYPYANPPSTVGPNHPCDFNDLITLGINFVNLLIVYSVPIAVISFIYAGFLYLTSQGNPGQISKAHGIFKTTGIGFVIVLSAWLIVYAITSALLGPGYSILTPPTG